MKTRNIRVKAPHPSPPPPGGREFQACQYRSNAITTSNATHLPRNGRLKPNVLPCLRHPRNDISLSGANPRHDLTTFLFCFNKISIRDIFGFMPAQFNFINYISAFFAEKHVDKGFQTCYEAGFARVFIYC